MSGYIKEETDIQMCFYFPLMISINIGHLPRVPMPYTLKEDHLDLPNKN